jgi:hypothetical protein
MIEGFSQGKIVKRIRDTKGTGKWDTVYYFNDNELVREERDTDGNGIFDLRIIYEKGQIVRQEGDTNGDRMVDVWVNFQNGEQIEQLEDQAFRGKITARYVFKSGQVTGQEQVADGEPPTAAPPFGTIDEELRNMTSFMPSSAGDPRVLAGQPGLPLGVEIK